ncbi:MAG: hypothetical protein B1H04_03630 [Planctomycetales bacterium 4484_123]|nr:MAG: hypothetical protein B1H04_03630 [Planctomycetales bacterium 4484_123]
MSGIVARLIAAATAVLCLCAAAPAEEKHKAAPPLVFEYQGLLDSDLVCAWESWESTVAEDTSRPAQRRADAYNNRAVWRYFRGRYETALDDLNEAIKLQPKAIYYSNRGVIHRKLAVLATSTKDRQHHWEQAKADYRKALDTAGGELPFAHNNLGWLLVLEANQQRDEEKRYELLKQAKEHLSKAAKAGTDEEPLLPLGHVNLAAASICEDDLKAADKHLKAVAGRVNKAEEPWTEQCSLLNLGELARCQGDWETAARRYQDAYQLGKPDQLPPPSAQLAEAKSTEADRSPWILQRLGAARFLLGWYDKAYRDLTAAAGKFGPETTAGRYAALLAALAKARQEEQKKIQTTREMSRPKRWIDALEAYLAGHLSARSLKGAARDKNPAAERAKKCEMYYYMGEKRLLETGGVMDDEARKLFKEALKAGEAHRLERTMAQYRLTNE